MSSTVGILTPLFALMALGYFAAWSDALSLEGTRGLTLLASTIEIPALLFRSVAFAREDGSGGWLIALAYLLGCAGVLAIAFVVSRFFLGLSDSEAGIFGMGAIYSNSSLIGIPIAQALLGNAGVVLLSKIIALHSLVLIPGATLYLTLAERHRHAGGARGILTMLANPMILALAAGFVFARTGMELPGVGVKILDSLATAATPTALIAVGATIERQSPATGVRASLTAVAFKLILHPLFVWLIAMAMKLPDKTVVIATVTAALPPGINAYAMAVQYGRYQDEAVRSFALGTLLSILTITPLLLAANWIYGY